MRNPRLTKNSVEQIRGCKNVIFVVQKKVTFIKVEYEDSNNFLLDSTGEKVQIYDRKKFIRSIKRLRNDLNILETDMGSI